MDQNYKRLTEYIPPLHKLLPLPVLALASVVSKDGMAVYASDDDMFKGAIFGRDSLEVADDLMDIKPALVHNILLTLGSLQGLTDSVQNEEQKGKIIHEYRSVLVDGKRITGTQLDLFTKLGAKWGGTETELAYYGSIDSTPHFILTLGQYCQQYGHNILTEQVRQLDGRSASMYDVARASMGWILSELAKSESGLLEYKMAHSLGTPNQTWKDSEEAYVHENGEMANHTMPIASVEVQGLVYDALMAGSRLFESKADELIARAEDIRDKTIATYWIHESSYFALGHDYDDNGKLRIITTPTANPAALLDSEIFDTLPETERQKYVGAIITRLTATDFITNAGIRSRSLTMANTVSFWDYHGSYVTWPKETYDIAKGMRRQGFDRLSKQLENRLLNLVLKTRSYPEFVYVDGDGRVLAGDPQKKTHGGVVLVDGYDKPEYLQAWTVSALMAIVSGRSKSMLQIPKKTNHNTWMQDLENEVLQKIPDVDMHLNPLKLWLNYPVYKYHLTQSKDTRAI